jgi:hypothetical protein
MSSENEREKKTYVLEAETSHFHLTPSTVVTVTGSANATIKTITSEFSKRIREKADLVTTTDTDDEKKAD